MANRIIDYCSIHLLSILLFFQDRMHKAMDRDIEKGQKQPMTQLPKYPIIPRIPPPKAGKRIQSLKRAPFQRTSSLPEGGNFSSSGSSKCNSAPIRTRNRSGSSGGISADKGVVPKSSTLDKIHSKDALSKAPKSNGDNNNSGHHQQFSKQQSTITATTPTVEVNGIESDVFSPQDYDTGVEFSLIGDHESENQDSFSCGLQDIGNNLAWNKHHDLIVDVNNVPQIDAVITPPLSPARSISTFITSNKVNNNSLKEFRRKFTSLKFKKPRPNVLQYRPRHGSLDNISISDTTIPTVTVNDRITGIDCEDMHREVLLSGKNGEKFINNVDSNVHYIGDETSLYGTPKDDLSPTKEVESQKVTQSATFYLKDQIISFFQPSDNKLAMKLFGNKNALMKEKMRQKAAGNWVIHPCSNFR